MPITEVAFWTPRTVEGPSALKAFFWNLDLYTDGVLPRRAFQDAYEKDQVEFRTESTTGPPANVGLGGANGRVEAFLEAQVAGYYLLVAKLSSTGGPSRVGLKVNGSRVGPWFEPGYDSTINGVGWKFARLFYLPSGVHQIVLMQTGGQFVSLWFHSMTVFLLG